jgi:hypothetical protein
MGANGKWESLVPVALAAAALLGIPTAGPSVDTGTSVQQLHPQQTDDLTIAPAIAASGPHLAQHESHAEVMEQFLWEATDYDLRERISSKTAALRNLILAHGFSRTRLADNRGA